MRQLAAGKKSKSIASKNGHQLVPALLNQHFQKKAVLSEDFPPDIMSKTEKTAHITGGDFEKVIDYVFIFHFSILRIERMFQEKNDAQVLNCLWEVIFFSLNVWY